MAYDFASGNGNYVSVGSRQIPQTSGTLCARWKPAFSMSDGASHFLFETSDGSYIPQFGIFKFSNDNIYAGWVTAGSVDTRVVVAASVLTQNAWNDLVLTYGASNVVLYVNGSSAGSLGSGAVTQDMSSFACYIGGNPVDGTASADGDVADIATYSREWTTGEVAAYHAGFTPPLIARSALVDYWPMVRDLNNRMRPEAGTASGTVDVSAHPRIINPRRRTSHRSGPAAPATGQPIRKRMGGMVGNPFRARGVW